MPNNKYWKDRFIRLQESQLKKGERYYADLEDQYLKASAKIEKQIAAWYQRFAANNQITLTEAKVMLSGRDLKEFKWDVLDYIKNGEQNALDQSWMKELENASARVHVSRLEALKLQTQQQIEVLYGNHTDDMDMLMKKMYEDGYYHTAFEIQKGFNVGYDLHKLNADQLEKVISKPWTIDNNTFSDRIWTSKQDLINSLHTSLTQGIIRGDAPDEAIKTIAKQFGVKKNQAGRLIMTESAFFASAAQKDCFNDLDVERFEVVATLDNSTSELCQGLDGHIFNMKDYEVGITAPPFHVWCRSVTVPYFDDNGGERAARGADGKTYYVSSDLKYDDWKKSFVDGGSKSGIIKSGSIEHIQQLKVERTSLKESLKDFKSEHDNLNIQVLNGDFTEPTWKRAEIVNGEIKSITNRINTIDADITELSKPHIIQIQNDIDDIIEIQAKNKKSNLDGVDIDCALSIKESYRKVIERFPILKGKISGVFREKLKPSVYAQCGMFEGKVSIGKLFESDEAIKKTYEKDLLSNFHPKGTDWKAIVTHELGHALDGYMTYGNVYGGYVNWSWKYASAKLRPEIMKKCGLKINDTFSHVSGYATHDAQEWFAECFAEYMESDNPRPVAKALGERIEEILKGVVK